MHVFGLYLVYDALARDIISLLPAPSDNAALLGFSNAKQNFEAKGYNPRLVQLYKLPSFKLLSSSTSASCSVVQLDSDCKLLCDLLNAPLEVERITNELLDNNSLNVVDVPDEN